MPSPIPRPKRILAYLRRTSGPQHYRVIARHLHDRPHAIIQTCVRMAADGRLRWIKAGTYALRQEGTP